MLTLITGRAGTGKTAAVINQIHAAVQRGEGRRMLIVPEQYSHEAERELCRVCGDALSRYAEVFSFTGLARRLQSQLGGGAAKYLDKGGRLLCMALALNSLSGRLKLLGAAAHKAEMQSMLLSAIDELKSACVSPDALFDAAAQLDDGLGDKLRDIALIAEAYDAVVANGHADPADRLTLLARQIPDSDIDASSYIYIDGFIDFTAQELEVLRALLIKGAQLTVCLTVDSLEQGSEVFELSRRAARSLIAAAKEMGIEYTVEEQQAASGKAPALSFFADNMFSYSDVHYSGAHDIRLTSADSLSAECELAAARALELVRDGGCRWRDIAVAVRGFDDYAGVLENTFRQYGVPLFTARKSELMYKPLPLMVTLVYDITGGGWDVDDVISYMDTGLTGLTTAECDLLSDYIFKWQLRAAAWERNEDWRQHPDGYGGEYDEAALSKLEEINELRRRLSAPLLNFRRRSEAAHTASAQAAALAELFAELKLPETLSARAESLSNEGRGELAQEYVQLWDIIVAALEQSSAVLGESEMDAAEFGRLFTLTLSKYDVGVIPVSLDRVSAGDFDRMRRRSIKHLIVLGASDDRLPRTQESGGMFSDMERQRLLEKDIDLGGGGEWELWREFSLIYSCLTLPSCSLDLCLSLSDAEGEA
ncbi:MAG: ATP-dependent nuclease subunit B, partial [Oscillospiraceae bacterium]|nr:ATP-dependent nuclease subunit B [Oscillospiraceae bacterium]